MRDLVWDKRMLGVFLASACLTEEEEIVLLDMAHGRSIASTAMKYHMSESKVDKIRKRIRQKYDSVQSRADLPPRKM